MEILNQIKQKLLEGGIKNVFISIEPVTDRKYIDENYSILVNDKKYFCLWIVEFKSVNENLFSVNRNVIYYEVVIKGYFGISNSGNSRETFYTIGNRVLDIVRMIDNLGGSLPVTEITQITGQKLLFNILCHYYEISFKIRYLKNREVV